jgi:hypothetical protein
MMCSHFEPCGLLLNVILQCMNVPQYLLVGMVDMGDQVQEVEPTAQANPGAHG